MKKSDGRKKIPLVAVVVPRLIEPFHFSVPYIVFGSYIDGKPLFELKIVTQGAKPEGVERRIQIIPDGGLEMGEDADILIVPFWHDLEKPPESDLISLLRKVHVKGGVIVGLCYGTYALAYAGLLENKRAATHWMAEKDFHERFPTVILDVNALYVVEDRLITSAGTGASLDCCLHIVREVHGSEIANRVARMMVIPPHREGGQAQFIEHPVAASTQDAQLNLLLDYLRRNLEKPHTLEDLSDRTHMSRRSFTRHFHKATGMSVVDWLVSERLRRSRILLETTNLSIEKISELVGFGSALSLRKHFKARFLVSPREWRKTFGHEL